MAFHSDATFPDDISYGSSGGPGFRTNILELDSGAEVRIARRTTPKHRYDVAYGIKTYAQLATVKRFYIARHGSTYGFRFKDFLDCNTTTDGHDVGNSESIANDDVQIGVGDGSETEFQLVKKYVDGGITRTRNITKPRSGVLVAVNGVAQTEGVDFTVNYETGVVTFSSAVTSTHVVTAGFEFDVPVRFAKEIDESFFANAENFGSGGIGAIPLVEIIDDVEQPDEFFYGGSYNVGSMSADISISLANGRVVVVDPQSSGLSITLPAATNLPDGGPYFYIVNDSATYAVDIRDSAGSFLFSVPTGSFAVLVLVGTTWYEGVV